MERWTVVKFGNTGLRVSESPDDVHVILTAAKKNGELARLINYDGGKSFFLDPHNVTAIYEVEDDRK
jgi:hypothetical protein